MAETTALIEQMLSAENRAGKYMALYILGLFVIWMIYREKGEKRCSVLFPYGIVSLFAVCFPPLLWILIHKLGIGVHYLEYLWLLPVLPVIAYAAAQLSMQQQIIGRKRLCAAVCMLLIALSGTVLPYHGAKTAVKVKYADGNVTAAIRAVCDQKEALGEPVLLLAQQEIMEAARRYDGDILLLYGKDMWMPEANTAVADVYPQDYVYAYERMKQDYEYPDEMAQLAERLGCNVLVLREKLSPESEQSADWTLAAELPGYLVYRISK